MRHRALLACRSPPQPGHRAARAGTAVRPRPGVAVLAPVAAGQRWMPVSTSPRTRPGLRLLPNPRRLTCRDTASPPLLRNRRYALHPLHDRLARSQAVLVDLGAHSVTQTSAHAD